MGLENQPNKLLSRGTTDGWGQIILCHGGCAVLCRMLSSISGLYSLDQIAGFAVPKAQHYIRVSLQALPLCLEAKQFHVPGAGGGRGQGRRWLGSSGSRGQHLSTVIKCLFVIRPFPPLQQKFSSIGTVCFQSHFQAGKNVPPPASPTVIFLHPDGCLIGPATFNPGS